MHLPMLILAIIQPQAERRLKTFGKIFYTSTTRNLPMYCNKVSMNVISWEDGLIHDLGDPYCSVEAGESRLRPENASALFSRKFNTGCAEVQ
jgi:hypothetical protein